MKLVVCIVHNRDKGKITDELVKADYKFTCLSSTGGFLNEGNTTLLVGVDDAKVDPLLELISASCPAREQLLNVPPLETAGSGAFMANPVKVPVGGSVVFVLNVERFERY